MEIQRRVCCNNLLPTIPRLCVHIVCFHLNVVFEKGLYNSVHVLINKLSIYLSCTGTSTCRSEGLLELLLMLRPSHLQYGDAILHVFCLFVDFIQL